jgi:hypothetical protein
VWGPTGSRPAAPKDLGFASAYLFGAVCAAEGRAAALIMPICNTAAMNHHLCEISRQVAAPGLRRGRLCPCRGDPRWGRLTPQPRARGARQHHVVGAAAVQPGAHPVAQWVTGEMASPTKPLAPAASLAGVPTPPATPLVRDRYRPEQKSQQLEELLALHGDAAKAAAANPAPRKPTPAATLEMPPGYVPH